MSHLPPNCEIEFVDLDERVIRLVFWGDDPYYSETFTYGKDEWCVDAAVEYCERFGWNDNWPNKTVDREALLDELEQMCAETIGLIEQNPEPFGQNWDVIAGYINELGLKPGRHGDDLDPEPYPYEVDDGSWREHEDSLVFIVGSDGKLEEIEVCTGDGTPEYGLDWDVDGSYDGPDDGLVFDTALAGCHYHCAKVDMYKLYMARTGDDPLGQVFPIQHEHEGVCTITITQDGYEFFRKHGLVPAAVKDELQLFFAGGLSEVRNDLKELCVEVGKTYDQDESGPVIQWRLMHNSPDEVELRVKYLVKTNAPSQEEHNKEVAFRGLEASIRKDHQYVTSRIKEYAHG